MGGMTKWQLPFCQVTWKQLFSQLVKGNDCQNTSTAPAHQPQLWIDITANMMEY
jgi:hypothetical protein